MPGKDLKFGVIGSGSWATALVKILADSNHTINWWVRNGDTVKYILKRNHNPHYLSSAYFNIASFDVTDDINTVVAGSDVLIVAVPSAYIVAALSGIAPKQLRGKKIVSAIKGLIPGKDVLLNDYVAQQFAIPLQDYFALLGPCHAEEVAAEKLSYLTFSGIDVNMTAAIAAHFQTPYINTIVNCDIVGVQYAAVLKNIYALGAGIAHGLEYGDNFLSVYIANSADEMASFLKKAGEQQIDFPAKEINYAASVYLGDLLVTCYSLYSRNRTFGNMIGKGYTVQSAQLEMNMVAEGYNASKCMYNINKNVKADMPIAEAIYRILWEKEQPAAAFSKIEDVMI